MRDNAPFFSVINVLPSVVYGRDERALNVPSLLTHTLLMGIVLGRSFAEPLAAIATQADDVARVHLLALDEKLQGSQDFGVTTPMLYEDVFEIVKKHFPRAVAEGVFEEGYQSSAAINWNAAKTGSVSDRRGYGC